MMAAIHYPHRRVLAVCGDGGFMMNSQELETAVRLRLNLVVLILQDNAYGMIRGSRRSTISRLRPDIRIIRISIKYADATEATDRPVKPLMTGNHWTRPSPLVVCAPGHRCLSTIPRTSRPRRRTRNRVPAQSEVIA